MPESPSPQEEQERAAINTENKILKLGYEFMLQNTWPFCENPEECHSSETAFFNHLEILYLGRIPYELSLPKLASITDPDQKERLITLWNNVLKIRGEMLTRKLMLTEKWENSPKENCLMDQEAIKIMEESPLEIREQYRKAVLAVICRPKSFDKLGKTIEGIDELPPRDLKLYLWQRDEKDKRDAFYKYHKMYLQVLRLYFQAIRESLEEDHIFREVIMLMVRMLEAIESKHSGLATAKTVHDKQKGKRVRKTTPTPYVFHEQSVAAKVIKDVLPFTIDTDILKQDFSLRALIAIATCHDTVEDGDKELAIISGYIERLFNDADTTIPIKSGSKTEQDITYKNRVQKLLKSREKAKVKKVLRMISNNTVLSNKEKIRIARLSPSGKKKTDEICKITPLQRKEWKVTSPRKNMAQPFKIYKEEYDEGKLAQILHQIYAISDSPELCQYAFIVKNEDRADNLESIERLKTPEHQLNALRATTTRLIAWQMMEYNHEKGPVYASLQRLIAITIEKYKLLEKRNPGQITELDSELMIQLTQWETELHTRKLYYQYPDFVKKIDLIWENANPPTHEDSVRPQPDPQL